MAVVGESHSDVRGGVEVAEGEGLEVLIVQDGRGEEVDGGLGLA